MLPSHLIGASFDTQDVDVSDAPQGAFAIALPFTLLFISLSWIAHRPLIGGLLLLLAAAIAGGVGKLVAKQAQSSTA